MSARRILLLCATQRGVLFARRLFELCPGEDITLATFPPEPHEPDYLPDLRRVAVDAGARLVVSRRVVLESLYPDGRLDLLIAVSWRYMVPRDMWVRAGLGAFVFHDSLLPKYRGFAPTVWAIINGETATGVSLLEMAESVDGGRLIDQERIEIGSDDTIGSVMARVTAGYLRVLERSIVGLLEGGMEGRLQDEAEATYGCRRQPADNRINWREPARRAFDLIRACSAPYGGAFGYWEERRVIVWAADPPEVHPVYAGRVAGRVVELIPGRGVRVLAGDHSLVLREVQVEGGEIARADLVFTKLGTTLV